MEPNTFTSKNKNKDKQDYKSDSILLNIKSNFLLKKIYNNIMKKKSMEIVRWNGKIQNRLNLSIDDYKEYSENFSSIEIEMVPYENKYGPFIKINENEKIFYHIFFNNNKEEIKNKYYIYKKDEIKKIRIIIDHQIKSFENLFQYCECIESINFKKFYRNNITNMSGMFHRCLSLKELNLSNFNTNNVIGMNQMFRD